MAEIAALPGVMAYGKTKPEAVTNVKTLALRVLADQVEKEKRKPKYPSPAAGEPLCFKGVN